jgi:FHS family L-fucose permease-like MFS transporter
VLALFALIAIAGSLVAVFVPGPAAMYGLITVGLGISIMFPAIFALAIRGLGPLTEEGSGPAHHVDRRRRARLDPGQDRRRLWACIGASSMTAACSLYVLFYALWGARPTHALPPESLEPKG